MSTLRIAVISGWVIFSSALLGCAGESAGDGCEGCLGCCLAGQCVPGDAPRACGRQGATCVACPEGSVCDPAVGGCVAECGPSCDGCCADGQCVPGSLQWNDRCGRDGEVCQACGAGSRCEQGTCQPARCDASNCSGCCSLEGACVSMAAQAADRCGSAGQRCEPCSAGAQCASGACLAVPPPCDASSCAGCCTAEGACLPLAAQGPGACGAAGAACAACPAPQGCDAGQCTAVTACDAATCPEGCCDGGVCLPWSLQSAERCGSGGNLCQSCGGGAQRCKAGVCGVLWAVSAVSATVQQTDTIWDVNMPSGPAPDPKLECLIQATGEIKVTGWVTDSYFPSYGSEALFSALAAELSAGVVCRVLDHDGLLPSQKIGECLFPSALVGGTVTSTTCSGEVKNVRLSFTQK